eukprot:s1518_g12.t1
MDFFVFPFNKTISSWQRTATSHFSMDLERGQIKLRTLPWAEARLSHAAAVAAANWDRPQVYVAEIKGMWPQERRRARRQRARARHCWYLHRTGQRPLSPRGLIRLRDTLAKHHSADTQFLHKINEAMFRFRQTPWKCRHCKRLNKANATYCGQCGRHWAEALDGTYRHPTHRQGSQRRSEDDQTYAQWQQDTPWQAQTWEDGRRPSQSPRTRSETPRDGRRHNRRGKNKNKGKQQGPGGPQIQAPALPEAPWSTSTTTSTTAPSAPSPAEQQLKVLMSAMKKNEAALPADLQTLLQESSKVQSQDMTKVLHSAVTKLGKAKKALQAARASRMNLHNVWRNYLQTNVEKWRGFCQDFEKQDLELAEQVQQATEAVKVAQEGLDASKKSAREIVISEDDSKDEKEALMEISDEETQEGLDANGSSIMEGMNEMYNNLPALQAKADSIGEGSAAKKARLEPPAGAPDGTGPSGPSGPAPFGQPGQ